MPCQFDKIRIEASWPKDKKICVDLAVSYLYQAALIMTYRDRSPKADGAEKIRR